MVTAVFPTPHTVVHTPRQGTAVEDDAGQVTYLPGTPATRPVYGWRPRYSEVGATAVLQNRTVVGLYLLTPDGDYEHGDTVEVQGRRYLVDGEHEDFNTGPFGFTPGYRVALRRVTDGKA